MLIVLIVNKERRCGTSPPAVTHSLKQLHFVETSVLTADFECIFALGLLVIIHLKNMSI